MINDQFGLGHAYLAAAARWQGRETRKDRERREAQSVVIETVTLDELSTVDN